MNVFPLTVVKVEKMRSRKLFAAWEGYKGREVYP